MRLVLYTFCGLPLRAGAIIIGLFTTTISCVAVGDLIRQLIRNDFSEIYTTRDDWLDYMSVKTSIVLLIAVVSFMQFVGGIKESPNLLIPFVVCGSFLLAGMLCDQAISFLVEIGTMKEFRGVVSPAFTILFFVWIDISYIHQIRTKRLEAAKPDALLP